MEPMTIVWYVLVIALIIVCLYYLYKWLYGASDVQDVVIWQDPNQGLPSVTSGTGNVFNSASGVSVPQIYSGGEYTVSVWIYVTKWDNTGCKPFLQLSGGGGAYNTITMFLGKSVNKLGVRVSTDDSSTHFTTGNGASTEYSKMLSASGDYLDSNMPMCDIEEIDLQRWVNITAVMMGRTVDVYVDGKLSRSSVLGSFFTNDGDTLSGGQNPTMILGDPSSFSGYIGMTRAANVAYTPDRVYANYQAGPFAGWSLASLDPSQYSLTLKRNSTTLFSTSGSLVSQ